MFFRAPDRHGREVNSRNFPTVLCQPQRVSALAAAHIEGDAGWDVAGIFQQHGVGVSRPQPVFFLVAGVPFGLALGLDHCAGYRPKCVYGIRGLPRVDAGKWACTCFLGMYGLSSWQFTAVWGMWRKAC